MTVRAATTADMGALLMLAERMHGESRFAARRFSLDKIADLFASLMASDDGLVLVAERDGAVIGAFAGYVSEDWFGPDKMAGDFGLFLSPSARGGMAAARLIRAFVAWAQARGVTHPDVGISTGVHTESTTRLYEAIGFERIGNLLTFRGN